MGIDNLQDLSPRDQYTATASQTDFAYTFPIFADGDLVVAVAPAAGQDAVEKALDTDYIVTGETNENGGTVVFVVPRSAGEIVTIYRDIPFERNTDVAQNGPWSSSEYNDELDHIVAMLQQLDANLQRTVRLSPTSEIDPDDLIITDPSDLVGQITTLAGLSDVNIPAPANLDLLMYNAATGKWISSSILGSGAGAGEGTIVLDSVELRGASFSGGGSALTVPVTEVPIDIKRACRITKVVVLTRGGAGSCVLDIWKRPFASYPPTAIHSITAAAKPTITTNVSYQDSTLTGWTTTLAAGDTLLVSLDSVSTFTNVSIFLHLTPLTSLPDTDDTDQRIRDVVTDILGDGGVAINGTTYDITIIGDREDVNVFDICGQPAGAVTVNFTVPAGSVIKASGAGSYALDFSGFASGSAVNFVHRGRVLAAGGRGGLGGSWRDTSDSFDLTSYPRAGKAGGNAIKAPGSGRTFSITNTGYIWGGGGGGGGGGVSYNTGEGNLPNGGGGGGGAGGG